MAKLEIKQAYNEFTKSREEIEAQQASLSQARRALELAETRYSNGLLTNLDVKDSRLALAMSASNYFRAVYAYNVSIAKIRKAIGIPADKKLDDIFHGGNR